MDLIRVSKSLWEECLPHISPPHGYVWLILPDLSKLYFSKVFRHRDGRSHLEVEGDVQAHLHDHDDNRADNLAQEVVLANGERRENKIIRKFEAKK